VSRTSYLDIKGAILDQIRAGELAPGDMVPGEAALAGEFGCARVTVNRALRELAEAGVVERRRKAGTRVLAATPRDAELEVPSVRAEIETAGAEYRYELLSRRIAAPPKADRAALGLAAEHKALWINLEVVPSARAADFAAIGPNDWLIRAMPLSRVEHVFSAANASMAEAELLGVEAGAAVFVVERRLVHPGATHRMVARTQPPL
jgi:GntR family histidine utilization transcriptional repressor